MKVRIHRGLTRMIINQCWSHCTRFALICYQIINNSGMRISDLYSKKNSVFENEYQVFGFLEFQSLSIHLNIGKEFAYTSLNNT